MNGAAELLVKSTKASCCGQELTHDSGLLLFGLSRKVILVANVLFLFHFVGLRHLASPLSILSKVSLDIGGLFVLDPITWCGGIELAPHRVVTE